MSVTQMIIKINEMCEHDKSFDQTIGAIKNGA